MFKIFATCRVWVRGVNRRREYGKRNGGSLIESIALWLSPSLGWTIEGRVVGGCGRRPMAMERGVRVRDDGVCDEAAARGTNRTRNRSKLTDCERRETGV